MNIRQTPEQAQEYVDNLNKIYVKLVESKCDCYSGKCHNCRFMRNIKLMNEFLEYLPPQALYCTQQGVRVCDEFIVRFDGTWKSYETGKVYKWGTVKDFIERYISPTLANGFQ